MRHLLLVVLSAALASAALVEHHYETKKADKDFLIKQRDIFHLLYHVHEPNIHKDQVKRGKAYDIAANMDKYTDVEAVEPWLLLYKGQILPKGRIFSIIHRGVKDEAEALYNVFYSAKDFETFYNTACWSRENINEQMFAYVLSLAVLHRADCQGIILPPPYEIHPYFFFSDEVIQKAYLAKMEGLNKITKSSGQAGEIDTIVLDSNYTGWYINFNDEQKLSYFTEDIALNSFYYNHHLDYPFWMEGDKSGIKNDRRGEIFYYIHQQLVARYYLERLSNGLGEIPDFSWRWPIETGYYPSLRYQNGMEFPTRPNNFQVEKVNSFMHVLQVEDCERRIRDSIDRGYLEHKNGSHIKLDDYSSIDQLASIIESSVDTPNLQFYRYPQFIARRLLGNSANPTSWHKLAPSALEHYQTSLRDPMFYQLFNRYLGFFSLFQKTFEPYAREELDFPGVKIENVEVEKLVTFFDNFETEITNVVHQTKEEIDKMEDSMIIKVRQRRLNHEPFTVTTNIVAEKDSKVIIKFFLGPKYNKKGHGMTLDKNRMHFVELDQFVYELKKGKNTVERNSKDFRWSVKDPTPSRQVYKDVMAGIEGNKEFVVDMSEAHNGFPQRLVLPKGMLGGMPCFLFAMVAPYVEPPKPVGEYDHVVSSGVGTGSRLLDGLPFGYPFNRPLFEYSFFVDNFRFKLVHIFHKTVEDANENTTKLS